MTAVPENLLTPKQAARILSVTLSMVYRLIKSGQLRAYKIGTKHYRLSREDVDAFWDGASTQLRELPASESIEPTS